LHYLGEGLASDLGTMAAVFGQGQEEQAAGVTAAGEQLDRLRVSSGAAQEGAGGDPVL
jgi:hypothetical protein